MPQLIQTTLTTERLVLRWVTRDDAPDHFSLFSDPRVTRYWSTPAWTDMAQARDFVDAALAEYTSGEGLRFSIILRDSDTFVGSVKLYDFFDQNRRCDVGYALLPAHWGKGYLAEAMVALLDYAFADLNMNRIEADIDPRNEASAKLLERMAFQKEGYMRERWIVNGEICDTAFYGRIKREWEAR
jgi:ribosomal-protein-alanine N-acetyltransferase